MRLLKKVMFEIDSQDEQLSKVFVDSDEAWELMTPQTTFNYCGYF